MLSIAGQTAGPVGLDFFLDTYRLKNIFFKNFFSRATLGPSASLYS